MKKRVIYFLMTLSFILTTITQAIVPVYAQTQTSGASSHLSKIINTQSMLESTSSIESVLSQSTTESIAKESQTKQASSVKEETADASVVPAEKQLSSANLTKVGAIQASDIVDGITNWTNGGTAAILGFKKSIKDPKKGLNYTFGPMMSAGNPTLDSEQTKNGGQMNVAITRAQGSRKSADLVGVYNGSVTTIGSIGGTDNTEPNSSLGYGLIFPEGTGPEGDHGSLTGTRNIKFSILINKMTDKVYYTANTADGVAMKVMGHFSRTSYDKTKTHQFLAELLLRPAPGKNPGVQEELYIKNSTNVADQVGVLLGFDTQLGDDDVVPVKAIGDDRGVYIEDNAKVNKLLLEMAVPDGPDDFGTPLNGTKYTNWYSSFDTATFLGNAQKRKGLTKTANTILSKDFDGTAYTAKWDMETIAPNETKHYRQDVIGVEGPVIVPDAVKTVTNKTSLDGKNRAGDTVQYKLAVTNAGYQDSWQNLKITDTPISDYLKVDDQSIKVTLNDYITPEDADAGKGTANTTTTYTALVPATAYDQVNKVLSVNLADLKDASGKSLPTGIGDNDDVNVTFNAKIKSTASEKTVPNHFDVTGTDAHNNDVSTNQPLIISESADTSFKVEKVADPMSMTKLVRNVTKDSQSTFKATTDASVGDDVQYQIEINASPNNPLTGAKIQDQLDANLKLTKTQVQYQKSDGTWATAVDGTWSNSQMALTSSILRGKKARVIIDATVLATVTNGQVINNTAELVAGSYGIGTTPDADAKVTIVGKLAIDKDSMHQYIKNVTPNGDGTTKDTADDLTTTTGVKDDAIEYTYKAKADAGNTEKLLNVAIANIALSKTGEMAYVKDSLKINGTAATSQVQQAFIDGNYTQIAAQASLAAGAELNVSYKMTIKNDTIQTLTNSAALTATALDNSVAIGAAKGIAFNFTTLNIKKQENKADVWQNIKNASVPNEDWQGPKLGDEMAVAETAGNPGDVIDYRFTITPKATNSASILNAALEDIMMNIPTDMQLQDVDPASPGMKIKMIVSGYVPMDVTPQGVDSFANLKTVQLFSPLAKGKSIQVFYRGKISPTAKTEKITNDANFHATNIVGNLPTDSTVTDKEHKIKANTATLNVVSFQPKLTKQVGVIKEGATAPTSFADSIEARPSDKIQYRIEIAPDAKKALTDIAVEDVLDQNLTVPNTVQVQYQLADGTWGASESVAINAAGRIALPNHTTSDYQGWQKVRLTVDTTIKSTAKPTTKIDNQASLIAGSYGIGSKTNTATVTLVDRLEVNASQSVNNLTTGEGPRQIAFGSRGDVIEYNYKVNVLSSNTADLKKFVMKNIRNNQPGIMQFIDGSLEISKNGSANSVADNAAQEVNLKNNAQIDLDDTAVPATQYNVKYQMQIVGTTYRSIANDADLTATKLDNATDPVKAPNIYNIARSAIMPLDKPQAIVKQEVTNTTRPESDNADKTETAAKVGDKLHYTFKVTTRGQLTNTVVKDIIQTPSSLMDYDANSLKVTVGIVGGDPIDLTTTTSGFPDDGLVKVGDLGANQVLTVSYDRTLDLYDISQSKFILNAGMLVADRLASTDPNAPIEDVEKNQIPFNTTKVNVKTEQNIAVYSSIKNETTPDKDWQQTTEGSKDDLIGYRFVINANSKNNADVKQIKLAKIALEPNKDSKNDDVLTYVPNTFKVVIDGVVDTSATLSADHKTITLGKALKPGQVAVVLYQMKVNTEEIDIPIKNHATLSAERLTDKYGDELKDVNGAVTTEMPVDDTILNLVLGKSQITIRYVDMDKLESDASQQTWIAPTESAIGKIKEPFSKGIYAGGSKDGTVVGDARVAPKVIDGYTIMAVSESDDLVNNPGWGKAYKDDPIFTKDNRTITYGYRQRMISIEAPTYWDFGEHNKSQSDTTYYLEDVKEPQKVRVTDNYGVQSWQLQVTQAKPFMDDRKQVLKDAELQFKNGTLSADATNSTPTQAMSLVDQFNLKAGDTVKNLMTYKKSGVFQDSDIDKDQSSQTNPYSDNQGKGSWTYSFGNQQNANISIGLHVPDTTKRDNTTYTTSLDWSLTVAP